MVVFQTLTPALPLSFNPAELGFFARQLLQGLYVGFGGSLMFLYFHFEEESFFPKLLLDTTHLHLPVGQHLLLLLQFDVELLRREKTIFLF